MKIVFHRYGSICEPDYMDAFARIGLQVVEEDREIREKHISGEQRIRELGEAILTNTPAFVFSINFFPYIAQVCEKLKVLYVCVSVDCPVLELYSVAIRSPYNRFFLFDYHQYEELYPENPDCIFYLPLGTCVDRWDKVLGKMPVSSDDRSEIAAGNGNTSYQYDISLVGSLYTEKSPLNGLSLGEYDKGYVDALLNVQSDLPGQGLLEECVTPNLAQILKQAAAGSDHPFPELGDTVFEPQKMEQLIAVNWYLSPRLSSLDRIGMMNILGQYFEDVHLFTGSDTSVLQGVKKHGRVSSHKEMPQIFRTSKINLNPSIRSIQTGLSQRIWDVLGCGGFLLSSYQAEFPNYFEVGKHLECYETVQELVEKCAYYLEHEEKRQEIAIAGYELVKERHTVQNRVMQMLQVILEEKA